MYYNYHAVLRRLIREGKLIDFKRVEKWGNIAPAFVLFFEGHRPMPIREERVPEYLAEIASSPSSHLIGGGDTEE
ncbi:MAG: thermostable hemolysin delta-VPH [Clostridia bacterium]|nr:thermostable hemolysin delta-VPH [Clostridia bacterium]